VGHAGIEKRDQKNQKKKKQICKKKKKNGQSTDRIEGTEKIPGGVKFSPKKKRGEEVSKLGERREIRKPLENQGESRSTLGGEGTEHSDGRGSKKTNNGNIRISVWGRRTTPRHETMKRSPHQKKENQEETNTRGRRMQTPRQSRERCLHKKTPE